jgi:hypothetical protein
MHGEEFVRRSQAADEELVGFAHPDGPGWATREEVYYNTSKLGTGAKFFIQGG